MKINYEIGYITSDLTGIKMIIEEYNEYLYTN